jgi:predicted RNA-binding protein with PIN domain
VPTARHLLVDGANILHAWPELRRLLTRDRDAARSQLVQALCAVHDAEGWRVTIVFDGRGPELQFEQPGAAATFAVVYTPSSLTADDVIEQLVAKLATAPDCVVATGDVGERRTVEALGATVCAPNQLRDWCANAARRQSARVAVLRGTSEKAWRK